MTYENSCRRHLPHACFQSIATQNIPVLRLTPLFPVDYTRVIAR